MNSSLQNLINREYEARRRQSETALSEKKQACFKAIPRLSEIEREISIAGLKYNRMLLNEASDKAAVTAALDSAIASLRSEWSRLLCEAGYSSDHLDPEYVCTVCKDTGLISYDSSSPQEYCNCYRQLRIKILHSRSNLKLSGDENFANFDLSLYPDEVNETKYAIKKSPQKQILGIKDGCTHFIENFRSSETRNLLFTGAAGTGKTFMAACTASELMSRGASVLYLTAPSLFAAINEFRMSSSRGEPSNSGFYKDLFDVELLIIDDLGTESPSAARYAELLSLLDGRAAINQRRPCKTIISTNIDIRKLYEYYDERVASRIIGNFDIYKFAGPDIRAVKLSRKSS